MGMFAAQATDWRDDGAACRSRYCQGRELAAYEERLGSLDVRPEPRRRRVGALPVRDRQATADGNGQITARGSYHLDRGSYSVDLRSQNVRLQQLLLPGGERIRGMWSLRQRCGYPRSTSGQAVPDDRFSRGRRAASHAVIRFVLSTAPATLALGRIVLEGVAAGKQATITASADQLQSRLTRRWWVSTGRGRPPSIFTPGDLRLAHCHWRSRHPSMGRFA